MEKHYVEKKSAQLQHPRHCLTPPRWHPRRAIASLAASDTPLRPRSPTSSNDSKNVGSRYEKTSNVFTGLFSATPGTIPIGLRSGPILTPSRRRCISWFGGTRTNFFDDSRPQSKNLSSRSSLNSSTSYRSKLKIPR